MTLIRAAITSVGVPLFSCHSWWINIIPYQSAVLIGGLLKKKKKTLTVDFFWKKWSWMLQKNTFDFTSWQVWTVLLLRSNWAVVQELGCLHCLAFETNYFSKKLISSHPPNEHSRPIFRFTLSPIDSPFFLTCRNLEGVRLPFPPPAHRFDTTALLWLLSVTDPAEATGIRSRRRVALHACEVQLHRTKASGSSLF